MKKVKKKILGYITVDSGQILIVDPCYLSHWKDGKFEVGKYGNHYSWASNITCSEKQGGEIVVSKPAGTGVVSSSGFGDGVYPVVATIKAGRIQKLEIKFF